MLNIFYLFLIFVNLWYYVCFLILAILVSLLQSLNCYYLLIVILSKSSVVLSFKFRSIIHLNLIFV